MRISLDEQNQIIQIIKSYTNTSAVLYLYGSRVDDSKRGGDIDLLLLVNLSKDQEHIYSKIHYLLADLKQAIDNQKIDFSVKTKEEAENDPFLQEILPGSILLSSW